jgi:hypothetical protein
VTDSAEQPWEYRVEVVKNPEVRVLLDRLNQLGSQDWELVSNVSTVKTWVNLTGNDLVFVFKRPGVGQFTERPEDDPNYVAY